MTLKKHINQDGFTMIELIVVIVIIGILAGIAVPRFLDLQTQARQAVRDGLTSNLRAAATLAYAKAAVNRAQSMSWRRFVGCNRAGVNGRGTSRADLKFEDLR